MKKALTGVRLEVARNQLLDELFSFNEEPEKYAFYSPQDTENFHDGTANLAKAKIVEWHEIDNLSELLLKQSDAWFKCSRELLPVGIDCETTGLSPFKFDLLGVGMAIPKYARWTELLRSSTTQELEEQTNSFDYYFLLAPDVLDGSLDYYLEAIGNLLTQLNPEVRWVMHNAKFDMLWLLCKTGVMLQTVEDSICMAYLLKEESIALDKLANKYLGRYPTTLERMTGKAKKSLTPEVLRSIPKVQLANYCVEDCVEGLLISQVMIEKLSDQPTVGAYQMGVNSLLDLYLHYDLPCIHALVWAEYVGVLIDWENLSTVGNSLEGEILAIIEEIAIATGLSCKESAELTSSPEKLSKHLFETLQLPTDGIKQGKKGFYSTAVATLEKLQYLHPLPASILDCRKLAKLQGTYVQGLYEREVNGVVHTNFENTRTATGRLSSTDPNLQNIPNPAKSPTGKLIRQCFIASEGNVLVKADYSQFELRILAHFSQDKWLIDCYKRGLDVHTYVTALIFQMQYEELSPDTNKDHKKKRTLVKNINFGLIYGMTAFKLFTMARSAGMDYSLKQCEEMMNLYWNNLPGVRDWMAANRLFAIRYGFTETIFGRRRYFDFEHPYLKALRGKPIDLTYQNWITLEEKKVTSVFKDQESFRAIGNAPIQGSNADCIRRAMALCYKEWYGTDVELKLSVHDELVLQAPYSKVLDVADKLKEIMELVASGLSVPVKADPTVALNWGDC